MNPFVEVKADIVDTIRILEGYKIKLEQMEYALSEISKHGLTRDLAATLESFGIVVDTRILPAVQIHYTFTNTSDYRTTGENNILEDLEENTEIEEKVRSLLTGPSGLKAAICYCQHLGKAAKTRRVIERFEEKRYDKETNKMVSYKDSIFKEYHDKSIYGDSVEDLIYYMPSLIRRSPNKYLSISEYMAPINEGSVTELEFFKVIENVSLLNPLNVVENHISELFLLYGESSDIDTRRRMLVILTSAIDLVLVAEMLMKTFTYRYLRN